MNKSQRLMDEAAMSLGLWFKYFEEHPEDDNDLDYDTDSVEGKALSSRVMAWVKQQTKGEK